MSATFAKLKNRLLGSGGSAAGAFGAFGSVPNVCHSVCMSVVSALAAFGITLNILPLMFVQTYQGYFWWAAFAFTAASFYFYRQQEKSNPRDRNLLLVNGGLLLFGLPFASVSEYADFYRFSGGSLAIAGCILLLSGKRLASARRSGAASRREPVSQAGVAPRVSAPVVAAASATAIPKVSWSTILLGIVIVSFIVNQYLLSRVTGHLGNTGVAASKLSGTMKFTLFDVALAKERMDRDNDGICDACGMPVQTCIDAGQMDCTMGSRPASIGVLGSVHRHADFKVFVDGQPVDFSAMAHMERMASGQPVSSFIHVDAGAPLPERTGDVLHMHATGVPLEIFFRSIGMKLEAERLTLADGRVLENGGGTTLKFFVNGRPVERLDTYVFQDLDKILISHGPQNDPAVAAQLRAVTGFAQNH